jgi:lysophospholipase L1-like esterase
MKLLATGAFTLAVGLFFAAPEIRLRMALHGPGSNPERPSIVMLGDSHTNFVNWRVLTGCYGIANYGIGGDTTAQMLARLPDVLSHRPRLVIVMAGTNDARRYVPAHETIENLQTIKREAIERGIEYVVLTPPPLPSRGDAINAAISAASLSIPFTEADLLDDKIHLRPSGYAKWRDAIAPIVKRHCGFSSLNSLNPL